MQEIQFQLRPARSVPQKEATNRGRLPRVTQVLALAIQFEDMLRRGVAKDHSDLARLGCISKERISQIMRLLWLAPDIQHEILTLPRTPLGRSPIGEVAVRKIASTMSWSEQRERWANLAARDLNSLFGEAAIPRRRPPLDV